MTEPTSLIITDGSTPTRTRKSRPFVAALGVTALLVTGGVMSGCSSLSSAGGGDDGGTSASDSTPSAETEGEGSSMGPACSIFDSAAAQDPSASNFQKVDTASLTTAVGVTLPTKADCGFQFTQGDGSKVIELVWESGDVNALDAAVRAAGYAGEPWSDKYGAKNMYTGPGGLVWVHSGLWIQKDMPLSAAMFTFPG
ncbi:MULTISPECIES: hypothetical protein [unclassified Microbacterium]|uniref:hypothetical protein n=1 Tax=unclassified Microbacterium TaxID=2609290 RepID=UPI00364DCB02